METAREEGNMHVGNEPADVWGSVGLGYCVLSTNIVTYAKGRAPGEVVVVIKQVEQRSSAEVNSGSASEQTLPSPFMESRDS